jgi:hypothetical protein
MAGPNLSPHQTLELSILTSQQADWIARAAGYTATAAALRDPKLNAVKAAQFHQDAADFLTAEVAKMQAEIDTLVDASNVIG